MEKVKKIKEEKETFHRCEDANIAIWKAKVKAQREAKKEVVQKAVLEGAEGTNKHSQDHGDCGVLFDGAWYAVDGEGECGVQLLWEEGGEVLLEDGVMIPVKYISKL